MKMSKYEIVGINRYCLIIRDIGPHDRYMTVTNNAENVVKELLPILEKRRLLYYDSENRLDEIKIANSQFAGFAPISKELQSCIPKPLI